MGNMQIPETTKRGDAQLIRDAVRSVRALLPDSWGVDHSAARAMPDLRADGVIVLTSPEGQKVSFIVESKRSLQSLGPLLAQLRESAARSPQPLLYVSEYIGPGLRDALAAEGISYADRTGWVRLTSESPLILLTGTGAAKSPRSGSRVTTTRLNGIAAGRIIRVLCTHQPPLTVRELAALAGVSPGSVSKLLPTLAREGIIDRSERGAVDAVRRRALITRWVQDYSFLGANTPPGHFLAPRGVDRTLRRLSETTGQVTVTGSAAVRSWLPENVTPVVPLRLLALYADDPGALADELGLVLTDQATANVVITTPQDRDVLEESHAPPALALADVLTLPGRGDAEAEQFLDILSRTDPSWGS